MNSFIEGIKNIVTTKQVYVPILSILFAVIIYNFLKKMFKRLIKRGKNDYESKKRVTVFNLFTNIVKYFLMVVVAIIILDCFGIDTKSIIAGLSVFSVIIGLAVQDTIKDFLGGITIILENYYIVGDYVKYKDFLGQVTEFGLKSTKIKNNKGELLIIANRNVSEIVNYSQSKQNIILELNVAYSEDTEKVENAIKKILPLIEKIEFVQKGTAKYLGVEKMTETTVVYAISINCLQDRQWQIRRDALGIFKKEFDKMEIKIPK